jgi:hypothetical protein
MPKPDSAVESEVIVNEQVLHRFNIAGQDPQKAIGELLRVDGKEMVIIGVMKNFQYGRANDKAGQREVVFRYGSGNPDQLNLLIESTDILATRQKLEAIWKKIEALPEDSLEIPESILDSISELMDKVIKETKIPEIEPVLKLIPASSEDFILFRKFDSNDFYISRFQSPII